MADGTVVIKIDGDDREFLAKVNGLDAAAEKALGGTQSALARVGDSALTVGAALSAGVTVPVTAACTAATALAMGYEDAFAGVRKTVDMTEEGYRELYDSTVALSEVQPVSATSLFQIEAMGGQLGIANDNLLSFARVVAGMDIATDLGAEEAATEMAQFANITGMAQTSMGNLGSTVVALGNTSATTESAIMAMAMRIAGAGSNVGMTQAEILGLAASLSSVGIEAEAGGSAISTVISNIDKAVATNSKSLGVWAKTAGMDARQFAAAWKRDPVAALQAVVAGMASTVDEGGNLSLLLEDLGVTELRQTDMLKRLSGASDLMAGSVRTANDAWAENTALQREVDARNDTTSAKLDTLKNRVQNAAAELGGPLAEALVAAIDAAEPLIEAVAGAARAFAEMDEGQQQAVLGAVGLAAAVGPVTSGVGAAAKAVDGVSSALKAANGAAGVLSGGLVALGVTLAGIAVGAVADAVSELSLRQEEAARRAEDLETCVGGVAGAISELDGLGVPNLCEALDGAADSASGVAEGADGAAAAVGDLDGSGVGGLTDSLGEAAGGADELKARVAEALEESRQNVSDTSQRIVDMAGELSKVGEDNSSIRRCAETIKELGSQSDLTAADELRLKDAVDQYNEATGSSFTVTGILSGAYDDLSGSIDKITDSYVAQAKVQAIANGLTQLFADQVEQQRLVDESTQTLADAYLYLWESMYPGEVIDRVAGSLGKTREELAQTAARAGVTADSINDNLLAAYAGMVASGKIAETQTLGVADAQGVAADAVRDASEALDNNRAALESTNADIGYLSDALEEATAAQGEAERAAAGVAEAVEAQGEAAELAAEGSEELAQAQLEAAEAAEREAQAAEEERERLQAVVDSMAEFADAHLGMREAIEAGGSSLADFALGLDAAGISVDEFKGSFDSIASMVNPLERFSSETELYTTTMRDNLVANTEAVRSYSSNVAELYTRATTEQELAFADYVASLGPTQAQFLEYLLWDADVSFQELAVLYAEGEGAAAQGAVDVARAKGEAAGRVFGEGLAEGAEGIEESAAAAVSGVPDAMAEGADMVGAAEQMTGEAAAGIADGTGTVADAVREMGSQAADALIDMNEDMRDRGEAAGGHVGLGLADAAPYVSEGAQALLSAAQEALYGAPAAMRTVGSTSGMSLASGVSGEARETGHAAAEHVDEAAGELAPLPGCMDALGMDAGSSLADALGSQAALTSGAAARHSDAIGTALAALPSNMGTVGDLAGSSLAEGVSSRAPDASAAADALSTAIGSALSSLAPNAGAVGGSAGSSLAEGVRGQSESAYWSGFALGSAALDGMGAFNSSAYFSGREMGGNFASGIRSQVSAIASAAASGAEAAAAYLHHTTPDKGPLRGDDEWGAEMVGNYASGMLRALPALERASDLAARAAAFGGLGGYEARVPDWSAAAGAASGAQGAVTNNYSCSISRMEVRAADAMEAADFAEWFEGVCVEAGMM